MRLECILVLALSAVGPEVAIAAETAPPPAAPNDETPRVADPMLEPVPAAPRQLSTWREAIDLARARSTDLRTSRDNVLVAEAQQQIALAQIFPTITGNAAGVHNFLTNQTVQIVGISGDTPVFGAPTSTPTANYVNASVQLHQTVLNLEQFYAIGTARASTRASELSYEDMRRTIAQSVANDILGVVTAERVADLNRSGLRQALERLDLTVRKERLGAATGLDVLRAEEDAESARTTLASGDESLRKAREALGLAVGIPAEVGVAGNVEVGRLEGDATHACTPGASVEDRADIRSARTKVQVQDRLVNDVHLQFLPTLQAQSTLSTTTIPSGVTPQTQWNIQGVLNWTLWDGGVRYGNLRSQRAQRDQADASLEAQRRQALVQVEQTRRNVAVTENELRFAERARSLAVEVDARTQAGYRGGQLTSLDLVTAAAQRRQAEINDALAEFNAVSARLAAVFALATCRW